MKSNEQNVGISFVCQSLGNGGAERVVSILINYFYQKKYNVQLVLLYENTIDYYIPENISVIFLNWADKKNPLKFLPRLKQLRNTIKGDIVFSFLFLAIFNTVFANLFGRKKIIVSERNDPHNDPPGRIRKHLRILSYFLSDAVIFQTERAKKYFPLGIQKKGIVIPNPIQKGLIQKSGAMREKKVVSVCRLNKQKNIPMSLDAFLKFSQQYPDFIFEIYGTGELESEIKAYISKLSLEDKVVLKGFSNNVHKEIVNAMMYISSSDYEGISNSMLEAMAIGLPTICTDCPIGGARQVIKSQDNGILIPIGDVSALTNAMFKIVENKDFRDFLSTNAIKVRQIYDMENICREWEKVLNEIGN